MTTAEEFSAHAADWAQLWAPIAAPAREAVARATELGAGDRVLDIGCGTGEFCELAAARGATVSGIDAADGMLAIARRSVPGADLRLGSIEQLPWDDDSFDVVTAFNSLQFAADFAAALAQAARVARPGGRLAVCNWGRDEDDQTLAVTARLRELAPPAPPAPKRPDVGEPGVVEAFMRQAGLEPRRTEEVDTPLHLPDQTALERAFMLDGALLRAIEHSGEQAVRSAIVEAAAPFAQHDGSYRFEARFRYVVASV
jgi:SAM-dependent methyltransferase